MFQQISNVCIRCDGLRFIDFSVIHTTEASLLHQSCKNRLRISLHIGSECLVVYSNRVKVILIIAIVYIHISLDTRNRRCTTVLPDISLIP